MGERLQRLLTLSTTGGDRATAYAMSGKMVRRDGLLLCTWLESRRQNRWAWVDMRSGRVAGEGWFPETVTDNHCGAALALGPDGTVHAVTGGHHSQMQHYELGAGRRDGFRASPLAEDRATYPSLVCDGGGTLHLTYRRLAGSARGMLIYCRRRPGEAWSAPRVLVQAVKPGYIYWTNALAVGPDGRLHLVFSNLLPQADGGIHYGASYLWSDDSGETWRQPGSGEPVGLPASADGLELIGGRGLDPAWVVPAERIARDVPGPLTVELYQLNLSNPVVDAGGRPWVVVHNVLRGEAYLCGLEGDGWRAAALAEAVRERLPGHRIHAQSSLSRRSDGSLEAALMVAPEDRPGWGPAGTAMVRMEFDAEGGIRKVEPVGSAPGDVSTWLPGLEHWCWHAPMERPALLYTRGLVGSWLGQGLVNEIETSVYLDLP